MLKTSSHMQIKSFNDKSKCKNYIRTSDNFSTSSNDNCLNRFFRECRNSIQLPISSIFQIVLLVSFESIELGQKFSVTEVKNTLILFLRVCDNGNV